MPLRVLLVPVASPFREDTHADETAGSTREGGVRIQHRNTAPELDPPSLL